MPLSIFNFDFSPVAKAISATIITILIAWAIVPTHLPYDEANSFGAASLNELILEKYTFDGRNKPIVFVGSSITTAIPPPQCRPDNVASIYLQGGGPMTGLYAIGALVRRRK